METPRLLLIDDEAAFQRLCSRWLSDQGYEVVSALTIEQATTFYQAQHFDLVLLDLAFPPDFNPASGMALLARFTKTPVIVITGHAERNIALQAIKQGAWDFLAKPIDPEMLQVVVTRAVQKHQLVKELEITRSALAKQRDEEQLGMLGVSPSVNECREMIRRIADTEVAVMVGGPSGTGKELIAKAIHNLSRRKANPLVTMHCGAIPEGLLESELFGHEKGSFTGADRTKQGLLEQANGGTLFLDEVGEMPMSMQVKLLRVLQSGTFYRVGGRDELKIDVRVVSATNRDLLQQVSEGLFREDLYYRLKGIAITTQPLANRSEDIPPISQAILSKLAKRYDTPRKTLDDQAMQWLLQRPWPGNVRELEHCLESAVALAGNDAVIDKSLLQLAMGEADDHNESAQNLSNAPLEEQLQALEKRLILTALNATNNNHTQTAKRLGISRQGLIKKMKRLNL